MHQYRGHDLLALFFSFFFSLTSDYFCFHGESPLQVDYLPEAIFLMMTVRLFLYMVQPKFPTVVS
jgi:hypothetical protein